MHLVVLLQAALGLLQPLRAWPGNRARLPRAPFVKAPTPVAQPALSALRRRKRLGQLVAARVAEPVVFFAVDGVGLGLGEDRAICA